MFACIGDWGFEPVKDGYGIRVFAYKESAGMFTFKKQYRPDVHVGHLLADRKRKVLYLPDEQMNHPDYQNFGGGGSVLALAYDSQNGDLKELNQVYSLAPLPCYTCIDSSGSYLMAANHSGGKPVTKAARDAQGRYYPKVIWNDTSLVLYQLEEDGRIGQVLDIYKARGHGVLPKQPMPMIHSVVYSAEHNLLLACENGCNKVYGFRICQNRLVKIFEFKDVAGSAPRYGCLTPDEKYFIFNHERISDVTMAEITDEGLKVKDRLVCGENTENGIANMDSEILMSNDGKHLYNFTRGNSRVSVIGIDEKNEKLHLEQQIPFASASGAGGVRGAAISPDERYLFACAPGDAGLWRFLLNEDGSIKGKGTCIKIGGHPANLVFLY
jgi:6-phosphogluconolactonase